MHMSVDLSQRHDAPSSWAFGTLIIACNHNVPITNESVSLAGMEKATKDKGAGKVINDILLEEKDNVAAQATIAAANTPGST